MCYFETPLEYAKRSHVLLLKLLLLKVLNSIVVKIKLGSARSKEAPNWDQRRAVRADPL